MSFEDEMRANFREHTISPYRLIAEDGEEIKVALWSREKAAAWDTIIQESDGRVVHPPLYVRMVGMLRKLEWKGGYGACPACLFAEHAPGCELAALLREVGDD